VAQQGNGTKGVTLCKVVGSTSDKLVQLHTYIYYKLTVAQLRVAFLSDFGSKSRQGLSRCTYPTVTRCCNIFQDSSFTPVPPKLGVFVLYISKKLVVFYLREICILRLTILRCPASMFVPFPD
jgi:hypothetical protein